MCLNPIRLVLLRHGQSIWNGENRFTGWTDVPLSRKGKNEILLSSQWIMDSGIRFDYAYASVLSRTIQSINIITDETNHHHIPVIKSWRLNEKHYGQLQGLNKDEMINKFGFEKVLLWTSSYRKCPPPISWEDERNPHREEKYKCLIKEMIPLTEVLL